MEDLLSSQQCVEIIENRDWVFGAVPYHEACMRRAALLAVREFAERMAGRLERLQSTREQGAELLRCAARDLDINSGSVKPSNRRTRRATAHRGSRCLSKQRGEFLALGPGVLAHPVRCCFPNAN